jgi:H+/Cl- antiporter ClcA
LLLIAVGGVADRLQQVVWDVLPRTLGIGSHSPVWTIAVLGLTGVAVGLVVWLVPGHAGPDPATTGLIEPPLSTGILPGLVLALVLTLAGGISLGPENPIMAVNTGLVVAVGVPVVRSISARSWVAFSAAGMVGALFGTPVAAALIMSEVAFDDSTGPLWDRLFAPLVAAGAGALTTDVLLGPSFTLAVAPYAQPHLLDILTGAGIATLATLIGLAGVLAFPLLHGLFHRMPNEVLMLTVGGLVLGVLGVLGGPLTLFKGYGEMKELVANAATYGPLALGWMALVKLAALVVASTSGFRGGRIFPAVFVGVSLGLCANAIWPEIPMAVAVSSGVLGVLVAVTRHGWLSLFTAAILVPEFHLLPLLCIFILPSWLLATGMPLMLVKEDR